MRLPGRLDLHGEMRYVRWASVLRWDAQHCLSQVRPTVPYPMSARPVQHRLVRSTEGRAASRAVRTGKLPLKRHGIR
jgi:hypothetical protein